MGKRASKAVGNMYYDARCNAIESKEEFSSREQTSELIHIERTRLANIELGNITPYPEEVKLMAEAYNMPELCNSYCAKECPIGKGTVQEVQVEDFDRLALRVLGSLRDIDNIRASLIEISEDGVISIDEQEKFNDCMEALEKIANSAKALQLWAKKNIRFE